MQHPFEVRAPEYAKLLSAMRVTRPQQVNAVAGKLASFVDAGRYAAVSAETFVPQAWMAGSFEREASSNFSLSPAQGDRWDRVSTHVPRGIGPFPDWKASAKAAYHIDGLDKLGAAAWTILRACYEGELFNGFGYLVHGIHTPYLWAGTNIYSAGKFIADGKFSSSAVDQQLGIVPVMLRLIELRPALAFVPAAGVTVPGVAAPLPSNIIVPAPAPVPLGHGGGSSHDAEWIQHAMNVAGCDPQLLEDDNYGRVTKRAAIAFQNSRGLEPDGIAGPLTLAALEQVVGGG